MGCYKDWVCKEVVDVDKLGEVSICHLTIKFEVFKSSLEGIENVYAQHVPLLLETLDLVSKNRLPEARYPCVSGAAVQALRPAEVVVYIAGGATYEEATKVAELNASGGVQVVLGGSYVHNSGTFLEDLDDAFGRGGV